MHVRILDMDPEKHCIVYSCDKLLADGACAPDRIFVDVLMRSRDDLPEDARKHLREVLRQAGFAPGDFVRAVTNGCK